MSGVQRGSAYPEGEARPAALPGIATFLNLQQAPRAHSYQQRVSGSAAAYTPLYDGRIQQRAIEHSPTLREFQHITLSTPSSSGRSSISASSDGPARMQTSYKSKAATTVTTSRVATSSNSTATSRPTRTSRYLREEDRRDILSRIAKGERQADLAKEFQVSRAAISNLKQRRNKSINNNSSSHEGEEQQQDEYASGGQDDDDSDSAYQRQLKDEGVQRQHTPEPRVIHESNNQSAYMNQPSEYELKQYAYDVPELSNDSVKARSSPPYLSPARPANLSPVRDENELYVPSNAVRTLLLERVTEVTTLAMELLFTRLVDPRIDARAFPLVLSRVARLLLEHALSTFPTRDVQIPASSAQQGSAFSAPSASTSCYIGTEPTRPICAVSVSECGGAALVREFQAIEPQAGFGFISSSLAARTGTRAGNVDVQVPRNIHESSVLVLVELLNAQSSHHVVQSIQAIQQCGVHQQHVVLVTLCSDEHALVRILQAFPGLRVATVRIFARDGDVMSGELYTLLCSRLLFQEQNAMKYELQ